MVLQEDSIPISKNYYDKTKPIPKICGFETKSIKEK